MKETQETVKSVKNEKVSARKAKSETPKPLRKMEVTVLAGDKYPDQRTARFYPEPESGVWNHVFLPDGLPIGGQFTCACEQTGETSGPNPKPIFTVREVEIPREFLDEIIIEKFEVKSVNRRHQIVNGTQVEVGRFKKVDLERMDDQNPQLREEFRAIFSETRESSVVQLWEVREIKCFEKHVEAQQIVERETFQLIEEKEVGLCTVSRLVVDQVLVDKSRHRDFRVRPGDRVHTIIFLEGDRTNKTGYPFSWGEDLPAWVKSEVLTQLRICSACMEAKTEVGLPLCPTCDLHNEWEIAQKIPIPSKKGGKKKK